MDAERDKSTTPSYRDRPDRAADAGLDIEGFVTPSYGPSAYGCQAGSAGHEGSTAPSYRDRPDRATPTGPDVEAFMTLSYDPAAIRAAHPRT